MFKSTLSLLLAVTTTKATKSWGGALLLAALIKFTYVALIGVLIIAGLGVPIPEDIPLILSGYMCNDAVSPIKGISGRDVPDPFLMSIAGMVGVLIGDSIVFSIGRRGIDGDNFVARHIRKVMNSSRREKVEHHFAKHGNLTVFCGRFMPGFRSLVFAFAGMSKMSYLRFLVIDGFAALISVPAFVFIGWYFAPHIDGVWFWLDRVKHILLPVIIVLLVGGIAIYIVRRKRRQVPLNNPA